MSDPQARRGGAGRAGGPHDDTRYFDFHDPASRLAGFVRITTDLAASEAVTALCLWLPDGRTALASERAAAAASEDGVRTGGTRVRVNEPVEDVDVVHDGRVQVLDDPGELERSVGPTDASQAPLGPSTESETRLKYTFGSSLFTPADHPGRHAQLSVVAGTVRLGDYTWAVDARGLRCGARTDAPSPTQLRRRSLGAAVDDGFGFGVTETTHVDGTVDTSGFVWEGTILHSVAGIAIDTTFDERHMPVEVGALLTGEGGRTWQVDGRVRRTAPIHSPSGMRCIAALTHWTCNDGRAGTGTAHYHDQR